jgi:predicted DsbA family dithiol-disulfide isomerase/hemerythrin-like domain-containing protein
MEHERWLDPPDLQLHRRAHRALRRTAARLRLEATRLADGDPAGGAALARRYASLATAWELHARLGERVIFVEVARHVPAFAEQAGLLIAGHHEGARLITAARAALASTDQDRALAATAAAAEFVREHLDGEEADLFPLIERNVDRDAWADVESRAFGNIVPTTLVEPSMRIEIWSDIACPWCFIGKRRFEAALAEFPHRDAVEVRWRSYQLDPTLPEHYDGTELDYLASRKGFAPEQVRRMFAHVAEQAAGAGLRYDFDRLVVANSFRAHELIHATRHARGDELAAAVKERLLSDHFERGEDIGDLDHLVRVGTDAGLDPQDLRLALESGRYADDVKADIAAAQELGLRGVPFFVIERIYGVSGAQPVEVFREALERAWADLHPLYVVEGAGPGNACGPDGCDV